nr:FapA family protein [uncultured Dethiosulfovibrio sp.]
MEQCLELERSEGFVLYREGDSLAMEVLSPPVGVLDLLSALRRHADPDGIDLEKVRYLASSGGRAEIGYVAGDGVTDRASVKIVDDGNRCLLTLPKGFDDLDKVEGLLASKGVVQGLNMDEVRKAVLESAAGNDVVSRTVACGVPPVNGEDGWVEYLKERASGKPMTDETGEVDFYSLDLIVLVKKGEVLAIRHDPVEPMEGSTVTGKPVPGRKGKSPRVVYGSGIEFVDGRMIASMDGQVVWRGEKMFVEPLLEIKGNVGPETGNIRYHGTVLVHGDVSDGYNVDAEGDVEVRGCVERAHIKSGGNISIRYGVAGKEVAVIEAKGDVLAKFIQEAEVKCSALKVNEYILRAKISAKKGVMVEGRKGVVMSSRIEASSYVNVRSVRMMKQEDSSIAISGVSRAELFARYKRLLAEDEKDSDRMLVLSASIRTLSEKGLYKQATTRLAEFVSLEEAQAERSAVISEIRETLKNLKGDATLNLIGQSSGSLPVRLKGVSCRVESGARWMTMFYDPDSDQVRVVGRG